jgi:tetratricopeptide (TPR) repeat protein
MLLSLLALALLSQGAEGPLEDLKSSDRVVQRAAIEAVASALDHPDSDGEIAVALGALAREGDLLSVRRASLEALGRRGEEACLSTLTEVLLTLPREEQAFAARSLGVTPSGRARAWSLLARSMEDGAAARVPVAELMRVGSMSLAERGAWVWTSAELSPFARLSLSSEASTSQATLLAVDALLDVLLQAGGSSVLSFLDALGEAGYRADLVADHLCEVGLLLGEVDLVVEAAAPLSEGAFLEEDAASQARGQGYLATARFVAGDYERAGAGFRAQRDIASALAARPQSGRSELTLRSIAAQLAAKAEVGVALSWLASGGRAEDPEVLGAVQRAHLMALRSHLLSARADQLNSPSVDFLFGDHPAPWRILESGSARFDSEEAMRWQLELLAAFATVAPEEVPGITPLVVEGTLKTTQDAERLSIIREILEQRRERLSERLARREQQLRRLIIRGESDDDLQEEIERLVREVQSARAKERAPVGELLYVARRPSDVALDLAGTLREEGRHREARRLLESFLEDMESGALLQTYIWAIQSAARAESNLGSCLCDEDEPAEAERYFLRAVRRLEDLENHFASRGVSPSAYREVTSMRAGVLISLAVNANVRLKDTERALAYFERAYELRQDSFATVLLACYRARSGRAAEARVALARVVPEPGLYYNLACTHALLGDTGRALSFLELELSVNNTTRGARERQRAWARDDPDLASLRGEDRFRELTAER